MQAAASTTVVRDDPIDSTGIGTRRHGIPGSKYSAAKKPMTKKPVDPAGTRKVVGQ